MTVEINDCKYEFPVGWHEVTLDQFNVIKDLDKEPDMAMKICKTLEMLTGVAAREWFEMKASEVDSEGILQLIAWMQEPIDWEEIPPPAEVEIDGVKYVVPQKLEMETYGQMLMFDSRVLPEVTKTGSLVNVLKPALAIYLQPVITGKKFDADQLSETEATVGRMSIYDALPLANFFFSRYFDLLRRKTELSNESTLTRRLRQVLNN